jgi:ribosomal protein S27AE
MSKNCLDYQPSIKELKELCKTYNHNFFTEHNFITAIRIAYGEYYKQDTLNQIGEWLRCPHCGSVMITLGEGQELLHCDKCGNTLKEQ